MRVLLCIILIVTGFLVVIETPDPFVWRFNLGLISTLCGLFALPSLAAYRLRRSPRRWRQWVGASLIVLLLLVATLTGVLLSNYHLLLFRPGGVEEWRADLVVLRDILQRLPDGLRERAQVCTLPELSALSGELPALNNDQRHARLIQAIACLNDGHSNDFPFFPAADFSPVPLQIRHFDDGWFVTHAAGSHTALGGLQVMQIAGLDVEEAFRRMRPYVSSDNESAARVRAPMYMLSPRLWSAIGVNSPPDLLNLELATASGARLHIQLPAAARLRYLWWYSQPRKWLFSPKLPAGARPSAEWKRDPWWLTPMPDRKALYVAFRGVQNRRSETLTAFGERLLQTARMTGADRVIIDTRDNSGGDNTLFRGFVKTIAGSEYNAPGRLFVLIDGGTFSAATNFVTTMERKTQATLVGTPTGSGPNHFGDAQMHILPRTRIAVFLSTRRHQFGDAADLRTAHDPQVAVRVTSRDYFSGRDPVLEAALGWTSGQSTQTK